jgi:hypothetical protein
VRTVITTVVVLGIAWLVLAARNAVRSGTDRHVSARARHVDGDALVRERLTIRSKADPDTLQDSIVRGIALPYNEPTTAHAALFQGVVRAGYVQFCAGTKARTTFTAGMHVEAAGDGGTTLTYQVESWTSSDGIVDAIPQLKLLRRRIEEEARKADDSVIVQIASTEA